MSYSPQLLHDKLAAALAELTGARKFLIGLSGGLDSVVLLHALVKLRERPGADLRLRALHVNHGLQDQADDWEQHCRSLCAELAVDFIAVTVAIEGDSGIENAARDARYGEFGSALAPDEVLLLAHHRDDQMETLLLRLNRGSGSRGLSGMPRSRSLGASMLLRPLLNIDRDELQSYGESARLSWVQDHSNADSSFDRNYCRHKVLPLIEARWPGYRESWSKSALLASESEALNQELAALDLAQIATQSPAIVNRDQLLALSEPRRRNVLGYWLAGQGIVDLGWNRLRQLSGEVVLGTNAQFVGENFQIICFRARLHLLSSAALEQELHRVELNPLKDLQTPHEVLLPDNGRLRLLPVQGAGICTEKLDNMSIRYRQGGETCRLAGRPSKSLKKILQEIETPPWLRSRIPLLYCGDELACIPGVGVSAALAAKQGEAGCTIEWQEPDLTFSR